MDLERILLGHYDKYPLMEIQDLVKLIYQNEFAGGHLIFDEALSLASLTEEMKFLKSASHEEEPFEPIGNGLFRFYLAALRGSDLDISTLNRFFINSANSHQGNKTSFKKKLQLLIQLCGDGCLPFSKEQVIRYLEAYQRENYPMVSHSESYRGLYSPSYRVIREEYQKYFDIFLKVDKLLKKKKKPIIAIDGQSGAGKSTLAKLIAGVYDCNLFKMDDFFLPSELRTKERLAEVGGNIHYERFGQIIAAINTDLPFSYQAYNCQIPGLEPEIMVEPKRLSIVEGSYSMHPLLAEAYDLKIFLSIDEREQSQRILKRNGEKLHQRFLEEWIPLENYYFEKSNIKEKSDLVYSTSF